MLVCRFMPVPPLRIAPIVFLLAVAVLSPTLLVTGATLECGDLDADGTITTSDALLLLKRSVRQDVELQCPSAPEITTTTTTTTTVPGGSAAPNVILIMTDDQPANTLAFMPSLQRDLQAEGTTFSNFFLSLPWCCPSRATFLRGQYAHNHQIYQNQYPGGGHQKFRELGLDASTVGTWVRDAGYRTAYIGKYLNHYGEDGQEYRPPGWDDWFANLDCDKDEFLDCSFNDNGTVVEFGDSAEEYRSDLERDRLLAFIQASAAEEQPFFAFVGPFAPHRPASPAARHADAVPSDVAYPGSPSVNEADISDKPFEVRKLPLLSEQELDDYDFIYRNMIASLLAVDELIADTVAELETLGLLDNTYILFTTDNGYHMGEHRMPANKNHPYEEDVRIPLIVRGPGVAAGQTRDELIINTDMAPTIAAIAGAAIPDFVDGRSFLPLLQNQAIDDGHGPWRQTVLLEFWRGSDAVPNPRLKWAGLRTSQLKYVEWTAGDGDREFYDLWSDPFEMSSRHNEMTADDVRVYTRAVNALQACGGTTCRAAESAQP